MFAKTIVQRDSVAKRRALAQRHVELGRRIVEQQHEIIARQRATNMDTGSAEKLLTLFLGSQKIFEDDLARLIKIQGG